MGLSGDFFVGTRVSQIVLREALAQATDHEVQDVRPIDAPKEPGDDSRVFIITITDNSPGEYPGQYMLNADERLLDRFDAVAGRLAQELQVPILSAGGLDDPDMMILSLPDGFAFHVLAEQDEDGGIRNSPEMQHLIAAHPPASNRARAA